MSSAEQNAKAVREIYDLFFAGDIAGMGRYLADDAVIVEAVTLPYGGEYQGAAGLADLLGKIGNTWIDPEFEILDILSSEKSAAAYGNFSVTGKDTGKRVTFLLIERWTFENGKVTLCEPVYGDTALALQAYGQRELTPAE